MLTVQQLITTLNDFWARQGCALHQGYDLETGAGTFNPATFFRVLGKEPYQAAYVEPSRRPSDGRYGENPNRTQLFHQYQVIIKPAPFNIQQIYLQSLEALGFNLKQHDIRFVHDDWEQPSLGAWGLGWEIWRDGMEVSQFTYFQSVAGIELDPITVELTYGIERLALTLQEVDSFWELKWNDTLTYRDIFHASEVEWSRYNFEAANPTMWGAHFVDFEKEAKRLIDLSLPIPAYDFVMKASHAFNLLDARGVISVSERTGYITRLRTLAHEAALGYLQGREKLNFPLLTRPWPSAERKLPPLESLLLTNDLAEDFLLEIGSEELPATFVPLGLQSLHKHLTALLEHLGLSHEGIETYGTPRRLAAIVRKLAKGKKAETSMRRGPKVEAAYPNGPSPVATGFFRSVGRHVPPPLADIEKGLIDGVSIQDSYLYAQVATAAQKSADLLIKHLPSLILKVDFPKRMRWAEANITYARPLHWIVALHGSDVIPFALGTLHSARHSSAHAQLCPGTFSIAHASDYLNTLRHHKVLASVKERQETILNQLKEVTSLQPLALDELLPELLYLSEWPQLTIAQFDAKFLEVPQEVLISEMVQHQRDIPLADAQGRLTNNYVITADNTPSDEIRRGNTKVLSARLSDGRFLYSQDLKQPLESFNEKLKTITYIQALGTLFAKAQRVVFNTAIIHSHLPIADLTVATRAAELCKADLATELVAEFPHLQGIVGRTYALAHRESLEVAQAIEESWMPRKENAPLPASAAGCLVSLADKCDNLVSCFATGLKPTSSSDPYALRRQVVAIIKMLIERKCHLPLRETLMAIYAHFLNSTGLKNDPTLVEEILEFIVGRIRPLFETFGLLNDEITAVLARGCNDVFDRFRCATALHLFRKHSEHFPPLAEVYKRAKGLLGERDKGTLNPTLFTEKGEITLYAAFIEMEEDFKKSIVENNYAHALTLIAQLQPPLSQFFEQVKVLDADLQKRGNRLALLQRLFGLFDNLFDFSALNPS